MTDARAIDPRAHRVLAGESRVRVLECLRAHGTALSAVEISERVGLHANTVRLHLDQLVGAGLVAYRPEPRQARGRPRLLYTAVVPARSATDAPPEPGEDGYRTLAGVLAGHLERRGDTARQEAAAAGRAWARSLSRERPSRRPASAAEATEQLVGLMGRLGFAPSTTAPTGPVELHRCPFHQVAEDHSEVVCGVHLGLIQGVLEDLDAPLRVTGLEPFVTPDLCLAHLEAHPKADLEADLEAHPGAQTPDGGLSAAPLFAPPDSASSTEREIP